MNSNYGLITKFLLYNAIILEVDLVQSLNLTLYIGK